MQICKIHYLFKSISFPLLVPTLSLRLEPKQPSKVNNLYELFGVLLFSYLECGQYLDEIKILPEAILT